MVVFTTIVKQLSRVLSFSSRSSPERPVTGDHYRITYLESSATSRVLPITGPIGVVRVINRRGTVQLLFFLNGQPMAPSPIDLFVKPLTEQVRSLYSEPTLEVPVGLISPNLLRLELIDSDQLMIRLNAVKNT